MGPRFGITSNDSIVRQFPGILYPPACTHVVVAVAAVPTAARCSRRRRRRLVGRYHVGGVVGTTKVKERHGGQRINVGCLPLPLQHLFLKILISTDPSTAIGGKEISIDHFCGCVLLARRRKQDDASQWREEGKRYNRVHLNIHLSLYR